MMTSIENRRESKRIAARAAVQMNVDDTYAFGEMLDVTLGGMRVRTQAEVRPGAHVTCLLGNGPRVASVTFKVRWARGGECGLEAVNTPQNPRSVQRMTESVLAFTARVEAA